MGMVTTLKRLALSLLAILWAVPSFGAVKLYTQNTAPATCNLGDLWVDTNATSGERFHTCESTNTWVLHVGYGTTSNPSFNSVHASGGNLAAANKQVTKAWQTGLSYTADVTSVIHGGKHWIAKTTHTAGSTTEPGVGANYADAWTEVSGSGGYTNLTSFVNQTNWRIFYSDGSGDVKELALGASGTVLKSNGASAAPSFQADDVGSGSFTYPGAGVPNSTGSAWGTSYTVGTAANDLVQLNASAQLPAVSGANLTNLGNASGLSAQYIDWNASSGGTSIANKPTIPTVSDTAYDATSWNGNTDAPSKNAVRDKIESIGAASMVYPGAGIPQSTGSAWGTSITAGTGVVTALGNAVNATGGLLTTAAIDDTPDNGSTVTAPSANWAYDHSVLAASESAIGHVELATTAEVVTGSDTSRAVTAAGVTAKMAAPGAIGGTTPSAGTFTTITASSYASSASDGSRRSILPNNTTISCSGGGEEEIYNEGGAIKACENDTEYDVLLSRDIGTAVQAYDADLTTWAGVTPGTGIATALAINTGSSGAPVLFNGAGGTPTSLTLTNATIANSTSLPGTCTVGQIYIDTDADTDGTVYFCRATNTWKDIDDDGGSGGMATTDIDTSAELYGILTDETGSGAGAKAVFNQAPRIDNIELGADTDTTLSRSSAGVLAVEGVVVPTISSSNTLTNKTLDVEGTGNSITIVDKVWFAAAGCNNATATSFYDLPTSNAPAAACITGTNTQKGVLDFDADTDESAQVSLALPSDWSGNIDLKYKWLAAATSGNVVWAVQTSCVADAETDDPSWNTVSTVTDAVKGTTLQTNDASMTSITVTGCATGELMHLRFYRDADNASDTMTGDARLIGTEVTLRRAQ